MSIDQRARSAVADLRVAAAATEDNELLPSRRWMAALALLVVVLLAAGVAVLATDDERVVTADDGQVAAIHLTLASPPDGVALNVVSENDLFIGTPAGWWRAYGDLDLVVDVVPSALGGDALMIDRSYEEVVVGARTGYLSDVAGLRRRSLVLGEQHHVIMLGSDTLTDDELIAIGAATRLEPDGQGVRIDPSVLPLGLEPSATIERTMHYGFGPGAIGRAGALSTTTSWSWPDRGATFDVTAVTGADAAVELLNRAGLGPDVVARTVHGQPAWQSADGYRLVWREPGDVLVAVYLTGFDDPTVSADDLLALAESVAPVDADAWAAMLATHPVDEQAWPTTAVPEVSLDATRLVGDVGDGHRVIVYRDFDGNICGALAEGGRMLQSGCSGPPVGSQLVLDDGRPVAIWGQAPPGTVAVTATVRDALLTAQVNRDVPDAPIYSFFLFGGAVAPTEVVFLDGAGNELGRDTVNLPP